MLFNRFGILKRISSTFSVPVVFVSAHDGDDDNHSTITQSAFLACATGEAGTYATASPSLSIQLS
jgi:hypothetical protein